MSYIPDYRSEDNEKHLTESDRVFLQGYRAGLEDAQECVKNLVSESGDEDDASGKFLEELKTQLDCEDVGMTCAIFDNAGYIPEEVDIKDVREPLYKNTKGARALAEWRKENE